MTIMSARVWAMLEMLLFSDRIRSHRVKLRLYSACISGADAVKVWINSGIIQTVEEGVMEGKCMLRSGLLKCLTCRVDFRNSSTVYRLSSSVVSSIFSDPGNAKKMLADISLLKAVLSGGIATTRRRHFKKYPNCFVGFEAVQLWLNTGLVETKLEAVNAGRRLLQHGLIRHIAHEHHFENKSVFFVIEEAGCRALQAGYQKCLEYSPDDDLDYFLEEASANSTEPSTFSKVISRRISGLRRTISIDYAEPDPMSLSVPFFEDRTVPFFNVRK
mmetsp:Transcript_4398/g.13328  ORF Transcript_4398/g.13328 Transcript_4398/m.13328 type:complete len:273 (+) Transcript_4398:39-857(+)